MPKRVHYHTCACDGTGARARKQDGRSLVIRQVLRLFVSFQVTILKVLAGHPGGRVSLAELRQAVAILISSGTEWTDRTRLLAARAPGLDIFSQSLVSRDHEGWQITDAGRALLASIETPVQSKSNCK